MMASVSGTTNAALSPVRRCSYCGCPESELENCAVNNGASAHHTKHKKGVVKSQPPPKREAVTLLLCSGCRVAFYCGKEHQRLDWKARHQPACKKMQQKRLVEDGQAQHAHATPNGSANNDSPARPGLPSYPGHSDDGFPKVRGGSLDASRSVGFSALMAASPEYLLMERRATRGLDELAGLLQNQHRRMIPAPFSQAIVKSSPTTSSHDSLLHGAPPRPRHPTGNVSNGEDFLTKIDHSANQRFNLATDLWLKPSFNTANDQPHACHAPDAPTLVKRPEKIIAQEQWPQRIQRTAYCVSISLKRYGWVVLDNFLGPVHCGKVLNDVRYAYDTPGNFTDGQLVKTQSGSHAWNIRSDKIHWFDNRTDKGSVNVSLLVSIIDSVVTRLSDISCSINGRSKAMIACYPGDGSKYVRHVDNPDKDGRCITSIYYLNHHWNSEWGGILRLYPETALEPVDIEPIADRIIFFWSDKRNPHEVLPSYAMRYAITIWYFDKAEREAAKSRGATPFNGHNHDGHGDHHEGHQALDFLSQNRTPSNSTYDPTSSSDATSSTNLPSTVTSQNVDHTSNGMVNHASPPDAFMDGNVDGPLSSPPHRLHSDDAGVHDPGNDDHCETTSGGGLAFAPIHVNGGQYLSKSLPDQPIIPSEN